MLAQTFAKAHSIENLDEAFLTRQQQIMNIYGNTCKKQQDFNSNLDDEFNYFELVSQVGLGALISLVKYWRSAGNIGMMEDVVLDGGVEYGSRSMAWIITSSVLMYHSLMPHCGESLNRF